MAYRKPGQAPDSLGCVALLQEDAVWGSDAGARRARKPVFPHGKRTMYTRATAMGMTTWQ